MPLEACFTSYTASSMVQVGNLSKLTKEQKKATIMVTHDERMLEFCDKVYVITDGVINEKID